MMVGRWLSDLGPTEFDLGVGIVHRICVLDDLMFIGSVGGDERMMIGGWMIELGGV